MVMMVHLGLAVFPNKCGVSLAAMGNSFEYQSRVNFWDDVFGKVRLIHCTIYMMILPILLAEEAS